ncbi:type VII secretion integral membrane protein EccD [Nocardia mangyaensis]|uniref:type VII secretion integral membrane protein EccD n=1 Tax=Nocardia mangyaensis TaxID=2213200 RepID=UPI002674F5EB|nr:type VII secretion integral membrane protein EccD [Nocardia mangyaensis]MDO3648200.1 type VII secretion integral membrane protein EccD [Nocardia mangyaensis]
MTAVAAPAAEAATSAEVDRARVAIMVATYQVDAVVPTKFAVETFIDDLLEVLAAAIEDDAVDFTAPVGQWSLAKPGQPPIPRWRSLADHDVADGAVLVLTPVESAEVFRPIVEDITDALALINEREFAEYDAGTSAVVGFGVLVAGAAATAGMLAWSWLQSGSILWCAVPALLLGAVFWGAAVVAGQRFAAPRACLGSALAALALMFAGGAMLVPGEYDEVGRFTAANLAAGAVVAAVAAATMMRVTRVGIATLMSAAALGIVVAVAALPATYLALSPSQVAAGVVLGIVILLASAPRIAVVIARIRPPDLPDPGNEVAPASLTDIFDAESGTEGAPDDPQRRSTEATFESRARLAVTSLRGLVVALSLALSVATVLTAAIHPGKIREIVLAVAVAGILMLRARWYPDRVQAIALVTGSVVTATGLAIVLVGVHQTPGVRLLIVALLLLAAVLGCFAAVRLPNVRLSPVTRRITDLFEYLLLLMVPVLTFWIMGIYAAMRAI